MGFSYLLSTLYNWHFHFDWADKVEFGPGGKHEKLFHLFIDSQITFVCPFAYAGLATGNQMYDEGQVCCCFARINSELLIYSTADFTADLYIVLLLHFDTLNI